MSSAEVTSRVSSAEEKRKLRRQTKGEWEVMPGLKEGEKYAEKVIKFDGYLHKKRNPPLKGWHRRYFVIDEGSLMYSKTPADHVKGRHHGKIDIGLSVLSFNKRKKKIDIDAEDFVCHIRTKNLRWFEEWVENLRKHRLYRHNELSYGSGDAPLLTQISQKDLPNAAGAAIVHDPVNKTNSLPHSSSGAPFVSNESLRRIRDGSFRSGSLPNQGKVIAWLIDNDGNEQCNKDFAKVQGAIDELATIKEKLENNLPQISSFTPELSSQLSTESHKRGSISKILSFKSSTRKERKQNQDSASQKTSASSSSSAKFTVGGDSSDSNSSSSNLLNTSTSSTASLDLCMQFISNSQQVMSLLKNLNRRIKTERDRLRHVVQDNTLIQTSNSNPAVNNSDLQVQSLKQCLQEVMDQNDALKKRLGEKEGGGDSQTGASEELKTALFKKISIPTSVTQENMSNGAVVLRDLNRSHSLSSKASEMFYDASDQMAQEEGEATTSNSNQDDDDASSVTTDSSSSSFSDHDADTGGLSEDLTVDDRQSQLLDDTAMYDTGRRSILPAAMSTDDVGLFSLLTKNIGKDLTRISMPVTLNEPLNTLQLLCEELEYSELLDQASESTNPYERMMYVAAFAVSAYASTNTRAATKPFNPILGETYECIRLDKGWKFVAEQVSHHPPISVCHADSENFVFKQDCRVKTKFWGKSMEFHPSGTVSVEIPRHNEEYHWKKVTTCVHNVLGGQRWVDQYGDMVITCKGIQCKLNFIKASYWSNKRHEVQGTIRSPSGEVELSLFGKWTESLYYKAAHEPANTHKCIWRAGNLPLDHDVYYGFTRFAVELNELREEESAYLPITDTRFRPDQRLLEEGQIEKAESEKHRVERIQREARKQRENSHTEYHPRWFKSVKGAEQFIFTEDYWKCKRDPGFDKVPDVPKLW